ncbi:hypothetical protein C8R46DRAFT_300362 [Mycena filopes]|nr:hypothetical protein C8R46DRAFT_300362 [Mycena filopes]
MRRVKNENGKLIAAVQISFHFQHANQLRYGRLRAFHGNIMSICRLVQHQLIIGAGLGVPEWTGYWITDSTSWGVERLVLSAEGYYPAKGGKETLGKSKSSGTAGRITIPSVAIPLGVNGSSFLSTLKLLSDTNRSDLGTPRPTLKQECEPGFDQRRVQRGNHCTTQQSTESSES